MEKGWLPGFLILFCFKSFALSQCAKQICLPLSRLHVLLPFFCAWYFKTIITCCLLRPPMYVCPFYHFSSFPSPRSFSISHAETDTPPSLSLSLFIVMVYQSVRFPHSRGGGVRWTCSALPWHLSEPHLSSVCRDGNEQEWHNMPELKVTAHSSPPASKSVAQPAARVLAGGFSTPSFQMNIICNPVMSHHLWISQLQCCGLGVRNVCDVCLSAHAGSY